jgi:hypothetical protein
MSVTEDWSRSPLTCLAAMHHRGDVVAVESYQGGKSDLRV